jgi:hypothetical protein
VSLPAPARHRVGPGAAVEAVRPGVAGQHVVERVAGAVDVGGAGQDQVLDIGAERVVDRALDRVGPWLASSLTVSPALSTT